LLHLLSISPLHPQRMHHRWSRPRACGTDLRRWKGAHRIGRLLVLGLDASSRRAAIVLLRMRVRYCGPGLPLAWVIVQSHYPGAWEPQGERMLR
jgi:hypothetical protein